MSATDPAARHHLGIDLGGTKIEAALFDGQGATLWRQRVATPAGSYDGTVAAVLDAVIRARQITHGLPITVGIGTPGSATPAGLMKNCNSTCLNGRPLQHDISTAIGQPAWLANDANCLALSEATDGAGAGAAVVFAAILGTGTGAGITVHGRVLTGPNGLAGEWGHNPLPWAVPGVDPSWPCYCGRSGCIETLLSGPGLARDHAAFNHRGLTSQMSGEQISQASATGDTACATTLERHAQRLARALGSVINLLDPDVVVLGGGLSNMAHLYTRVPQLWGQWVFAGGTTEPLRTRLAQSQHGDASGVRGAAWVGRAGSG